MTDAAFAPYWGKTAGPDEPGWHRLVYHCLDVAAVGQACLERGGFARLVSTGDAHFDRTGLAPWVGFLLALHDLGKFARSFQAKRPDIQAALGREPGGEAAGFRHDALGDSLWCRKLRKVFAGPGCACAADLDWELLNVLTPAVFGHHGAPAVRGRRVRPVARGPRPHGKRLRRSGRTRTRGVGADASGRGGCAVRG